MGCRYIQKGVSLDYTPSADVAGGTMVICGTLAGIAERPISSGSLGAVTVEGVFACPKATGAITMGAKVYWDATNSNVTTTATSNTIIGAAAGAAASGDSEVLVKLNAIN